MVSPWVAFSFGLLSFFTPCVLPVVPAVVAYSTDSGKFGPITTAIGLSVSFTLMGIIASIFGNFFHMHLLALSIVSGFVIIFFGLYMIFDIIGEILGPIKIAFSKLGLSNRLSSVNKEGLFGGFILGLSLGVIWTPCVGPILGSILTMVTFEGDILNGGLLLFIYSLGLVLPILIIAYTSNTAILRIKSLSKYGGLIKRVSGIILIIAGIYLSYQALNL